MLSRHVYGRIHATVFSSNSLSLRRQSAFNETDALFLFKCHAISLRVPRRQPRLFFREHKERHFSQYPACVPPISSVRLLHLFIAEKKYFTRLCRVFSGNRVNSAVERRFLWCSLAVSYGTQGSALLSAGAYWFFLQQFPLNFSFYPFRCSFCFFSLVYLYLLPFCVCFLRWRLCRRLKRSTTGVSTVFL